MVKWNKQRIGPSLRLLRKHPRYFAHLARRKADFTVRYKWVREHSGEEGRIPQPLVYKLLLNWSCNLRCPMCMLWGEVGWVDDQINCSGDVLSWDVIEKIFATDLHPNASFIFSGGEPMQYEHFGKLLLLLREYRKFAIICTNGTLFDRHMEQIENNPYPTFLISLDGSQEVNDRLRGRGVFERVMRGVEQLQKLHRPPFIGIQFTVMPENVASIESFCEEMIERGVDWILLNPGWFLSQQQARDYEHVMRDHFDIEAKTHLGYMREYDYDKAELQSQLEAVWTRKWPIQIASHLKDPAWVSDFIDHPAKILGNSFCYKQWLRMDVLPDGRVAPCVQFPDLTVGNLNTHSVDEVWQGEENRRFQAFARTRTLPICAKCNAIYQYGG